MKKSFRILFTLLFCLCPVLFLAACGRVNYYKITADTSDYTLGTVIKDREDSVAENTKVSITARENDPDNTPFVCWIKDNQKIVEITSYDELGNKDNTLVVESSAENEGNYRAVFQDTSPATTMYAYASFAEITFAEPLPEGTTANYQIGCATISAGSDNYFPFEVMSSVAYFGDAYNKYEFKFAVTINVTNEEETESITVTSNTIINRDSESLNELFGATLEYPFAFASGKSGVFTLSLSKVSMLLILANIAPPVAPAE